MKKAVREIEGKLDAAKRENQQLRNEKDGKYCVRMAMWLKIKD